MFISYEISPVIDNGQECIQQLTELDAMELAANDNTTAFWSLYGRGKDGLAEWIADGESFDEVRDAYTLFTGIALMDNPEGRRLTGLAATPIAA